MNRLILISVVCMQVGWICGAPNPAGVGAYAYQDSQGNRYGGTYGLNDDQVHHDADFNPVPFGLDFDDFFPAYFRNFENLLQEILSLYPIPSSRLPLQPLKQLQPLWFPPRLFPPQPPLEPLKPLQPLAPLQPLKPLQRLRPLQPLLPFQPIELSPFYYWQTLASLPSSQLRIIQPLAPLQPLRPLQPLPPRQPLHHSLRLVRPLWPLRPPKPLQPIWLMWQSKFPFNPPNFSLFYPWRLFQPLSIPVFRSNKESQTKALDSAKKAYDITSNQPGFMNFDFSRFSPFNAGFGNFGMPNFGAQNSAFASGAAMPGYSHQIAAINPANPNQPNVNIQNRFGVDDPNNRYMSVSSSSYASSTNVNGQEKNHRGAETLVNNNGVVHHYKVES